MSMAAWGNAWAPGAWADGTWGLPEVAVPQPQPGGGGGATSSRKRGVATKARKPRALPAPRRTLGSGLFVRVDDEDTREEARQRIEKLRAALAVTEVIEIGSAGSVDVLAKPVEIVTHHVVRAEGPAIIHVITRDVEAEYKPWQMTRSDYVAIAARVAEMEKQLRKVKRNVEDLEMLLLAA